MGKLATSELGAMPITEPDTHAPTCNPWKLEHSAGGSSGGAGAAVAAGLLPIAHGSDGGGSIRIPASLGHLFGIKTSRGATPNPYARLDRHGLVSAGPLAHTVDDAAAMLDVLAGNPGVDAEPDSFRAQARAQPKGLSIRFTTTSPLGRIVAPEVVEAVGRVAQQLEDLGHHVDPAPMLEGDMDEFLPIYQWQLARVPVLREGLLQPVTRWLRDAGRSVSDEVAAHLFARLSQRVATWFGDADLWLLPTVPTTAPRVGAWAELSAEDQFMAASALGDFTAPFNVSGQPAANIPAGIDTNGLPIGVQLVGPKDADGRILAVAHQLEEAMPWRQRRSPLALQSIC